MKPPTRRPEVVLKRIVESFKDLLVTVEGEPALADFLPAARELYRQVRLLHRGEREIPKFLRDGVIPIMGKIPRIPTPEAASRLLGKIERLPGAIPGEDEPTFVRAYARVLRNMTVSMMHAIFQQYPEVIPERAHVDGSSTAVTLPNAHRARGEHGP